MRANGSCGPKLFSEFTDDLLRKQICLYGHPKRLNPKKYAQAESQVPMVPALHDGMVRGPSLQYRCPSGR